MPPVYLISEGSIPACSLSNLGVYKTGTTPISDLMILADFVLTRSALYTLNEKLAKIARELEVRIWNSNRVVFVSQDKAG
jgi:hypothetical protein